VLIFLDTARIDEIRKMVDLGVVDGVTTNPSLMARAGRRDYQSVTQEICSLVQGPVSAEVISTDPEGMAEEALRIAQWSPHVAVKIPLTSQGLRALKILKGRHADPETICAGCAWLGKCGTPPDVARELVAARPIQFNVTLIFSANQALLAAKAGAAYVSPFAGRLDDAGDDGMRVVQEIRTVFDNYGFETKIIAASIRNPLHLVKASLIGADVATVPYKVLNKAIRHPLTDAGVKAFLDDWESAQA
jgi:transaldolase